MGFFAASSTTSSVDSADIFCIDNVTKFYYQQSEQQISKRFFFQLFNKVKFFISLFSFLLAQNGGCSSVVERAVVVRVTRVRFSPSALNRESIWEFRLLQNANFEGGENFEEIVVGSPCSIYFTLDFFAQRLFK